MASRWDPPFWVGDREFSAEDLASIQEMVQRCRRLPRQEVIATVCENLSWRSPNGRLKVMSCRQLLKDMDAAGLIDLPESKAKGRKNKTKFELDAKPLPPLDIHGSLADLRPITLDPVLPEDYPLWNATMAAYHPLSYRRPIGAHQRYWIRGQGKTERVILGLMLFGAAAKAVAVRDAWIGWNAFDLSRFRPRIVNNNRYLILPGVQVPHLASHVLGIAAHQLPADWQTRYGFRPVLLETFVEVPWVGTCYRAANWLPLGETLGRGRDDRYYTNNLPIKTIWVYPLLRKWRQMLMEPLEYMTEEEDDEFDLFS